MLTQISDSLQQLRLGTLQSFGNVTMVPLLADDVGAPRYLTLDEALANGTAKIMEISESGSVPELWFENQGDKPVLLMDGEELIGARQNRIINITILVGGHKKIAIPVSCVERGRWSYVSREFRSANRTLFSSAKAAKMRDVSQSLHSSGTRRANQSAIWEDIAHMSARMSVNSSTEAMSDIYDGRRRGLDAYQSQLRPEHGQAGAAFAIAGKLVGLEVFDSPETFRKLFTKLVAGYALDAIDHSEHSKNGVSVDQVRTLLNRIANAPTHSYASLGEGEDIRLAGDHLAGGALLVDEHLIHLAAFEERD